MRGSGAGIEGGGPWEPGVVGVDDSLGNSGRGAEGGGPAGAWVTAGDLATVTVNLGALEAGIAREAVGEARLDIWAGTVLASQL